MSKIPAGVGPKLPQAVVLFGATGDLSQRKLLPGLFHLITAGFIPKCRIIGVSLDDITPDDFRVLARKAIEMHHDHPPAEGDWPALDAALDYVPIKEGAAALAAAVKRAGEALGEFRLVHYLSVPPSAALSALRMVREAGLSAGSRIIMEKPFGHDLESAVVAQRQAARGLFRGPDLPHRPFPRQGAGAEHPRFPLRQRPVRADLEPQLHRPRADRRARDAGDRHSHRLLRADRRVTATWS